VTGVQTCALPIFYTSTASKGGIQGDMQSEWQKIVMPFGPVSDEQSMPPQTVGGWTVMARSGVWQFNGVNVAILLTVYSNAQRTASVLCRTTAAPYLQDCKNLMGSIRLNAPATSQTQSATRMGTAGSSGASGSNGGCTAVRQVPVRRYVQRQYAPDQPAVGSFETTYESRVVGVPCGK
jgi:hypothetical protein